MVVKPQDYPKFCDKNTCYDEVVMERLDDELATMKGDKLVGFHLIGSHGPTYYRCYPGSHCHFLPDYQRSDIENCTVQGLENIYDNTICYSRQHARQAEKIRGQIQYSAGLYF